jgi:uncharacterized protein (DUF427 family)
VRIDVRVPPGAVRAGLGARFTTIPDVHYGDDAHFVAGDRGASEWTLTGTTTDGERFDDPDLAGLVQVPFDAADKWLEEDEVMLGHARDPFARIDVRESSRHVRIEKDGRLLAETTRPVLLFETGLVTRYYMPREDIVAPIEESDRHTTCPYKGVASYYTVGGHKDIAWYYPEPIHGVEMIKDLVAFWNERVDLLDHAE